MNIELIQKNSAFMLRQNDMETLLFELDPILNELDKSRVIENDGFYHPQLFKQGNRAFVYCPAPPKLYIIEDGGNSFNVSMMDSFPRIMGLTEVITQDHWDYAYLNFYALVDPDDYPLSFAVFISLAGEAVRGFYTYGIIEQRWYCRFTLTQEGEDGVLITAPGVPFFNIEPLSTYYDQNRALEKCINDVQPQTNPYHE